MRNIFLMTAAAATAVVSFGVGTSAYAQAGSYGGSCRNTQSSNGVLTAECADTQGRYHISSIPFQQCKGDIGNNNGMLTCSGAVATGGQIVGGGNNDNRGGNDRRDNNNNTAAAVVAGAVLGGALAGNGGPTIVYGDQRYGDPRFDRNYAQGGWGYGRRVGEWVPIRNRADWLDTRIERAQREGRLSRREARDLRQQLNDIEAMEERYMRDRRLGPRERADLDNRFANLNQRISFEATDRDGRPDRFRR